jgi:hypothetical protein
MALQQASLIVRGKVSKKQLLPKIRKMLTKGDDYQGSP